MRRLSYLFCLALCAPVHGKVPASAVEAARSTDTAGLVELVDSQAPAFRRAMALDRLARLDPGQAAWLAEERLERADDALVQSRALTVLKPTMTRPAYIALLSRYLETIPVRALDELLTETRGTPEFRSLLCRALSASRGTRTLPLTIEAASDSSARPELEAAFFRGYMWPSRRIETQQVAEVLKALRSRRGIPWLKKVANDAEQPAAARREAQTALAIISER